MMPDSVDHILYALDLFGVFVFAVSGALSAGRKQMDLFGVIVIAIVTALGGGTLRDIVLGLQPVSWIDQSIYIYVAVGAALLTFLAARFITIPHRSLQVADALGLAVFTVLGTQTALNMQLDWLIAVMMGVISAVFGGVIRDVLSDEIPLILRGDIYATASFAGALTLTLGSLIWPLNTYLILASALVCLMLRLAAMQWGFRLPSFHSSHLE
jgi:uncharacterized membrane protein YeiH